MTRQFNRDHWKKKIGKYLEEPWSNQPSPFVTLVQKFLKPSGKILELGTGAGQDGLWLESQGFDVVLADGDEGAFDNIQKRSLRGRRPLQFDITNRFPFEDGTFDGVYAQLVLHYFDDETMRLILAEIKRVLKNDGILAIMVNTVEDPEYKVSSGNDNGIIETDSLSKRYFSVETLAPFVEEYEQLLFNARGRTPKDDAVSNSGMIQFVGKIKK